jgi:hypothetical protein
MTVVVEEDGMAVPAELHGTTMVVTTVTVLTGPAGTVEVGAPGTLGAQVMRAGLTETWLAQIPWK